MPVTANPLQLPFDFPPNATPTTHQLQANFNALLGFVNELNLGLTQLSFFNAAYIYCTDMYAGISPTTGVAPVETGKVYADDTLETRLYSNVGVGGSAVFSRADDGTIQQFLQPSFLVYVNSTASGFCGNGSEPTVNWTTEIYDQGNNFNISTDTFTAPCTGKYQFCGAVALTGVGSAINYAVITLHTSNRNYVFQSLGQAAGSVRIPFSVVADMDTADTAYITVTTGAGQDNNLGTADTDLEGNASLYTFWSGTLIN